MADLAACNGSVRRMRDADGEPMLWRREMHAFPGWMPSFAAAGEWNQRMQWMADKDVRNGSVRRMGDADDDVYSSPPLYHSSTARSVIRCMASHMFSLPLALHAAPGQKVENHDALHPSVGVGPARSAHKEDV